MPMQMLLRACTHSAAGLWLHGAQPHARATIHAHAHACMGGWMDALGAPRAAAVSAGRALSACARAAVWLRRRYSEEGKETWVPVKKVSASDQQAYMVELYERCLETRKKTAEELSAKYLQPLGKPRKFG